MSDYKQREYLVIPVCVAVDNIYRDICLEVSLYKDVPILRPNTLTEYSTSLVHIDTDEDTDLDAIRSLYLESMVRGSLSDSLVTMFYLNLVNSDRSKQMVKCLFSLSTLAISCLLEDQSFLGVMSSMSDLYTKTTWLCFLPCDLVFFILSPKGDLVLDSARGGYRSHTVYDQVGTLMSANKRPLHMWFIDDCAPVGDQLALMLMGNTDILQKKFLALVKRHLRSEYNTFVNYNFNSKESPFISISGQLISCQYLCANSIINKITYFIQGSSCCETSMKTVELGLYDSNMVNLGHTVLNSAGYFRMAVVSSPVHQTQMTMSDYHGGWNAQLGNATLCTNLTCRAFLEAIISGCTKVTNATERAAEAAMHLCSSFSNPASFHLTARLVSEAVSGVVWDILMRNEVVHSTMPIYQVSAGIFNNATVTVESSITSTLDAVSHSVVDLGTYACEQQPTDVGIAMMVFYFMTMISCILKGGIRAVCRNVGSCQFTTGLEDAKSL